MSYEAPAELLELLADPETKGPLRLANDEELKRLRAAVAAGGASRRDGKPPKGEFEAAFLAQEGAVAYVVEDGIPIFLIDERLELAPPLELDAPIESRAAGSAADSPA
jgi:uncharacterized protein YbaR (Trm112 family)